MESSAPLLVVGLGNPGKEYAATRHNAGFWVVDRLQEQWRFAESVRFHGVFASGDVAGRRVSWLKPQTYMNRSGLAVGEAVRFFKIPTATNVLVIADEVDLPPGGLLLRKAGGAGGHNGLKSLFEGLGTQEFLRMRVGVGRGPGGPGQPIDGHVLSPPRGDEKLLMAEVVEDAARAVGCWIENGFDVAMNRFNKNPARTTPPPKATE